MSFHVCIWRMGGCNLNLQVKEKGLVHKLNKGSNPIPTNTSRHPEI
jgi:hypothetical protein